MSVKVSTLDLVKSILEPNPQEDSLSLHLKRLSEYNPSVGIRRYSDAEMHFVRECESLDMRLFVRGRSINKFKYHAGLKTGILRNHFRITYTGDLPDFVLDNLDKIKSRLSYRRMTIHSMFPLPVAYTKEPVQVDPVLILWEDSIALNILGRVRDDCLDDLGVVVAMWDMDKEICI